MFGHAALAGPFAGTAGAGRLADAYHDGEFDLVPDAAAEMWAKRAKGD